MLLNNKLITEFSRFNLVGVLNTLIGLSVIYFCMHIIGLGYIVSNISGYAVGLTVSFFLNRSWTFRSDKKVYRSLFPFLAVFALAYSIQLLVVFLSIEYAGVNPSFAQAAGIIIYALINFSGNKCITFR
jgi:putative flippase GtrA